MAKLNQIIAVEKGVKAKAHTDLTTIHQALQKTQLLTGISRTYQPIDDDGEKFPPEATKVQLKATEAIAGAKLALSNLFDVTATKDVTNCEAKANVVVDGKILLTGVPATFLLFLEKQLVDIHTLVKKLPVLDPSENWTKDTANDIFTTAPAFTVKTKKVPKAFIKAPATDKHPAQVDVFTEDVVVGNWKTVKFCGSLPQAEVNAMVDKVEKLQQAVKFAREEANGATAKDFKAGEVLLSYLFG